MKKENNKNLFIAVFLLTAFAIWTAALRLVDIKSIGPKGSSVGFAGLNSFVHKLTGVHFTLYNITDWAGLVPIMLVFGFGVLGLIQWIKRRHIRHVDYSILVLGGFYIVVMAFYVLFETVVINYRPVLISGILEASYPSSTTMLVMCVMPTAVMQFNERAKSHTLRRCNTIAIYVFIASMVIFRLISGVHWFSDIFGGALLSSGLVMVYRYVIGLKPIKQQKTDL